MRIALYIEDGLEQIVLTPETETEKGILGKLRACDRELSVYSGEFYSCQGGWIRWSREYSGFPRIDERPDSSTIIVLRPKKAD